MCHLTWMEYATVWRTSQLDLKGLQPLLLFGYLLLTSEYLAFILYIEWLFCKFMSEIKNLVLYKFNAVQERVDVLFTFMWL